MKLRSSATQGRRAELLQRRRAGASASRRQRHAAQAGRSLSDTDAEFRAGPAGAAPLTRIGAGLRYAAVPLAVAFCGLLLAALLIGGLPGGSFALLIGVLALSNLALALFALHC